MAERNEQRRASIAGKVAAVTGAGRGSSSDVGAAIPLGRLAQPEEIANAVASRFWRAMTPPTSPARPLSSPAAC